MPNVTALPRTLENGRTLTQFTDTTSTSAVTYTYPAQQTGIQIENSGEKDIFVTVGSYSNQLVKADTKWKVDVSFTSFSISSVIDSQEFIATAFIGVGSDIGTLALSVADMATKGKVTLNQIQEPFILSHRGGANIYPENTLEAFRHIVATGSKFIEMDVQVLSDGTLAVMHDSTVDRTTSSTGNVADYDGYSWTNLTVDATSFLASGAKDTSPPLFEDVLREFGASVIYVPESKDQKCADKIAQTLIKYGLQDNAIIQSFSAYDLLIAVPYGIPTLLLTDNYNPTEAKADGFNYIGVSTSATQSYIQSVVSAGLKVAVYTIDKRSDWAKFQSYGCVACFTNDPLYISGSNVHVRTKDPFARQTWYHGQFATFGTRGQFISPNKWGWVNSPSSATGSYVLQGWASPIQNAAGTYSIQFNMSFDTVPSDTTAWGSVAFGCMDDDWKDIYGTTNGYHLIVRANGTLTLYKTTNGSATSIGTITTPAISSGGATTIKVDVTPTSITATRTDVAAPNSIVVNDSSYRGGCFVFGHNPKSGGMSISFSNVTIS